MSWHKTDSWRRAGTDGAILCWDLGKSAAGDGAVDPSSLFGEKVVPLEDAMEQASLEDADSSSAARILFSIPHEQKPNWMVCSGNKDQVLPATFFVVDTSNDITAYEFFRHGEMMRKQQQCFCRCCNKRHGERWPSPGDPFALKTFPTRKRRGE